MTYAISRTLPIDEPTYRKIRALLPSEAKGLVAHLVVQRDDGLQYTDVWESEADFSRFMDDHVEPALGQVLGTVPPRGAVPIEELALVDAWVQAPGA